jgi:lipid-binding SYLF domain-containing protein
MHALRTPIAATLLTLALAAAPLRAGPDEIDTVRSSTEVLHELACIPLKGIPPALLQDARGVAIIPNVLKAGFVLGGRYGTGVVLVRLADGSWSNPVFVTLAGGGIGWQIGVQSTDVVLVFKTANGLDRVLRGRSKVTLGADLAVAAGPVGRQAEAATDGMLRAEIYSYSRNRGLFAGVSLEGAGLIMDYEANESFYRVAGGHPSNILGNRGIPLPVVSENLKAELTRLSRPVVVAPPVLAPPQPIPAPPASPPPVVVPTPRY